MIRPLASIAAGALLLLWQSAPDADIEQAPHASRPNIGGAASGTRLIYRRNSQ